MFVCLFLLFVCFFLFVSLFVCLRFWKVRIEFSPFTYHVIFFFKKNRVLTFFLTLSIFLKSKNRVLTFFFTMYFFLQENKNWVLIFLLTMFVCLFDCLFVRLFSFVACLGFWKVRIEFLPFFLAMWPFFEKYESSFYFFPYPKDFFEK